MLNKPFSSAACKVFLGADAGGNGLGPELGHATGVRITEGMSLYPGEILGDMRVQFYEPTGIKYSGSFDAIHMLGTPLSSKVSNGKRLFFQGTTQEMLAFEPVPLVLVDLVSGLQVIWVGGWTPETRVWSISYGNIMTNNVSFVSLDTREFVVPR